MKTLVRLVILLFIIGAILIAVAVSGGVNLEGITNYISDDESYGSEIVYLSTTTIDTLNMDLDTRNIEISVTTEDHIIVSYYEHEKDTWTISELNGILNIKQTVKATFFNWFNFKIPTYEVSTVYIEVPSDLILEYSLISSTGDIKYIEGPVKATDVFIDSATGNLNLQNLDMDSLVIRMDTGNISLDDLTILGGLDAESDTGNIIISDVNSEDTLLETETGKITLTNLVSSSLNADTATDNISLTDSLISGQVILSSNTKHSPFHKDFFSGTLFR